MIEDHRGVVSGEGATAVRAERLAELLDREILPCLERPSRLLGPFDGVFRTVGRTPDVGFVWPSLAEGPDTPEALRPLLESALLPPDIRIGLACAPSPDVEPALASHQIPWFVRPDLRPLVDVPHWVVWIASPLQLLGLLSVCAAAGVDPRAAHRADGAPRIAITGPAAWRVRDLAAVYADVVVTPDALVAPGRLVQWIGGGDFPADAPGVLEGRCEAPVAPPVAGTAEDAALRASRAAITEWFVVDDLDDLRTEVDARVAGRGASYTRRIRVGSAAASLRTRHGLIDARRLASIVEEVLADTAGEIHLDFVLGLPGETVADRTAIGRMIADFVAAAPRGARQVSARVGVFVPPHEDLARGVVPLSPADVAATHEYLLANLPTKRTRLEIMPPALGAIEATLVHLGAAAAPVLEGVHAAGGRRADTAVATDSSTWTDALGAVGHDAPWFAEADDGPARFTGVASPTGCTPPRYVEPEPASKNGRGRRTRGRNKKKTPRPDRWARWEALVPRQFDHRVEFAKQGRLRFLGAGEVTEMFLRACERAGVPLSTSGVAQPRPRIRFGPSLTTGIEGVAEIVDLGLQAIVPDLLERLRPHLPEDMHLRTMLFVSGHAPDAALSKVAVTEYEATLFPDLWADSSARAASRARIASWHRRLLAGESCGEDADDDINQIRTIELTGDPAGDETLRYCLDIRGEGPKLRPREVLARGLAEVEVDVRCIPLRRLRLLAIEDDMGRERLVTPIEQVRRVERKLRARAKLSA